MQRDFITLQKIRMKIEALLKEKILILDGAMGTKIQSFGLTPEHYQRGQFAQWPVSLTGNNDILKLRNGFSPTLSGDIIIKVAPGWRLLNEDTQETFYSRTGFIPFPIIFYGAGTEAEHVAIPVTTDRIAPTIAKSIRIRAPNACMAEPLF